MALRRVTHHGSRRQGERAAPMGGSRASKLRQADLVTPVLVKTPTLVVVLSNDGHEIERTTAATGKRAVKAALLMLAKLDALRPGDALRVEQNG
jgi:hypothetical protein